MALISIIIATWNSEKTLKRCLDSIVQQLTKNIELIIVDGGSIDKTNEIIDSYGENISFHMSEPDKGVYDAWNKAITHSSGKWITFLGSDDELMPNAIQTYERFFNENKNDEYDIVCAKLYFMSNTGKIIREVGEPWNWYKLTHRKWRYAHPGLLHNRKLFDKFGLFDLQYKICADTDFLQRIGPNIKAGFINQFLVKMSAGGISDSFRAIKEGYLIRKNNKTLSTFENVCSFCGICIRYKLSKIKQLLQKNEADG